jgi:hypothetical protein
VRAASPARSLRTPTPGGSDGGDGEYDDDDGDDGRSSAASVASVALENANVISTTFGAVYDAFRRPVSPAAGAGGYGPAAADAFTLGEAKKVAAVYTVVLRLRRTPSFFRAWKRRHAAIVGGVLVLYRENCEDSETFAEHVPLAQARVELAAADVHSRAHVLSLIFDLHAGEAAAPAAAAVTAPTLHAAYAAERSAPPKAASPVGGGIETRERVVLSFTAAAELAQWAKGIRAAQKMATARSEVAGAVSKLGRVARLKDAATPILRSALTSPRASPAPSPRGTPVRIEPHVRGRERAEDDLKRLSGDEVILIIADTYSFYEPAKLATVPGLPARLRGREAAFLRALWRQHGAAPTYENRVAVFCARCCPRDAPAWLARLAAAPSAEPRPPKTSNDRSPRHGLRQQKKNCTRTRTCMRRRRDARTYQYGVCHACILPFRIASKHL